MHTGAWSDPHGGTPDERGSHDVARAGISPYLPRALDHVSGIPELRESWRDLLEERRTAARRVSRLLSYRARIRHESAAAGLPLVLKAEAEKAAVRNIAVTLGMAERTVTMLLNAAEYARENLPATWSAFLHGALDMPRVQKIATTASGMLSDKNRRVLDESAARYAAQVNAGTLQSWLNRAVAALDAEEYAARCQKAREDRFVRIFLGDDGMSDIHARIPTLAAAQLEKHLHAAALDLDAEIPPPLAPMETSQATAVVPDREAPPVSVPGSGSPLRARDADRIGDFDPNLLIQAAGFGIPDDPSSPRPEAREDCLGGGCCERTAGQGAADNAGVAPPGGESEPTPLARREGDRRTLIQREADMFTALLTGQHKDRSAVGVKIVVMVPAETLTGESNAPGVSADRSWALPAEQARELARPRMEADQIQHEWYTLIYNDSPPDQVPGHPSELSDASQGRTLSTSTNGGVAAATDPGPDPLVPKNLLAITYQGHDPPALLRDALMIRDGTCQAPGCTVPAERCDIDHQVPWTHPAARSGGGTTTASNLWHLCRRHHRMKSHGHLRPRPLTE